MAKFYVAWTSKPTASQDATFEYLIHPGVADGGVVFCNALVEAADRKAAWVQVLSVFPDAARQRLEAANDEFRQDYAATRRMSGVKVVKPRQPGAKELSASGAQA
jgi:hypothetical protein